LFKSMEGTEVSMGQANGKRDGTAAAGAATGDSTPTEGSMAIKVRGLRKSFGDHVILDGVDLSVPAGSVFALLGPNGAGKTTMVRILATLSAADAGEITIAGHDIVRDPLAVRSVIGVTGQFSAIDASLSAQENLLLMADLWHLPKRAGRRRSAELLELFDLAGVGPRPAFTFSGGMQRRLDLAMTLMGAPRVIFLDEPTAGLDPRGRRTMWELIRGLVREETVTIFLTTQYLEEADQLADLIAVLDHGAVVAQGTAAELKSRIPGGHALLTFTSASALEAAARQFGDRASRSDEALTLQVTSDDSARSVRDLLAGIDVDAVQHVALHTPDLDDVFLTLTGQTGKEQS
jgi:ABC-2 type transport system ATP-binding protein